MLSARASGTNVLGEKSRFCLFLNFPETSHIYFQRNKRAISVNNPKIIYEALNLGRV